MGELRLSYPACVIAGKSRLTVGDIEILREHAFPHGITSSRDAEALLAINTSCGEKCPEWRHYFIEAMTTFIVRFCYPQGGLDEINTQWLVAMISRGGVVASRLERDLLFSVIDVADEIPESLAVFALRQLGAGIWLEDERDVKTPAGLSTENARRAGRVLMAIARSRRGELTPGEAEALASLGIGPVLRRGDSIAA